MDETKLLMIEENKNYNMVKDKKQVISSQQNEMKKHCIVETL